ncbi:MAG: glycosyltransferase family 4 protein [Actinomycetota bacterium]
MTSRYPLISHTFVQREVIGLREAGYEIETFSVVRTDPDQILSPTDEAEAEGTAFIRPAGPAKLLRHLVRPALGDLGATLALLRLAGRGWWGDPRQLLWRFFYVAEAVMLWSLAASRGVGHLHAQHANVAANVSWLAAEFGTRVGRGPRSWSFTMHGSTEFLDVERHDLGAKAAAASGVACISDFTRSQLMMVTEPDAWDRFDVVHCGVDPSRFVPDPPERSAEDFTVLFVGRLGSEKGLPLIVDALGMLQERVAPMRVRFLVVGDGPLRDEIAARCAELGVDLELAGAVGQHLIADYYHRADAFCMASFREGIPVVLMEAMACEIPCVAPHITAIPELIEEGVTGLTATAGRADEIADRLERYATDPDFAVGVGKAGREKVLAEFTTARTIVEMGDFFDRVLGLEAT